jgi:hypothetical protein
MIAASSLRANGSRECAPDDRLREAIHGCNETGLLRRFAPRNDGMTVTDVAVRLVYTDTA